MTDIRVGDLVKATRKSHPEQTMTGRVSRVDEYVHLPWHAAGLHNWDFEVLDRPLPPVSDELLAEAVNAYRRGANFGGPTSTYLVQEYATAIAAVINFVRKYDAEHDNKESK
jgi:hypothetical protein